MNTNIMHLIQACDRLRIAYKAYHGSGNLLEIAHAGRSYLFANWATPLNDHAMAQVCLDKEYFYRLAHTHIRMPRTAGYVNPHCAPKNQVYVEFPTVAAIGEDIMASFDLPVIVKRNRGTTGINVFVCRSAAEIQARLETIFNLASNNFDYVALAQEHITIASEYRVLYLDGELIFAYEKNIDGATFTGNLSPLHWQGAHAIIADDPIMLERIRAACAPLFSQVPLRFCGLDIALDADGQLWLIEANSSPGFDLLVRDGGGPHVVQLYERMLRSLFQL
jgi:glutathione synthase/RimK-type ligase-like ATP-grasp enzyme